jgi:hypothetical protein
MRVVLEVSASGQGSLEGTATWAGQPEPASFDGTLELLGLLETAAAAVAGVDDGTEPRRHGPGGSGGRS